jgi:hypothetical protein
MAQAPHHPEQAQAQGQGGDKPKAGEPGSQRTASPAGKGAQAKPPKARPGSLAVIGVYTQSVFECQPGQQVVGEPAHPGYEEDRQHLRGRVVKDGGAEEDSEPKPKGVPKGAIMAGAMGTEHPDAPEMPEPSGQGQQEQAAAH